jgi:hypothetical protein
MSEIRGLAPPAIGGLAGAGAGYGAAAAGAPGFLAAVIAVGLYPMSVIGASKLLTSEGFRKFAMEGAKLNPDGWAAHLGRLPAIMAYESEDVQEAALEFNQAILDRIGLAEDSAPDGPGLGGSIFGGR